jgi:hypothetical protein
LSFLRLPLYVRAADYPGCARYAEHHQAIALSVGTVRFGALDPSSASRAAWVTGFARQHVDNRPLLETVLSTAAFYRLTPARAREIVAKVVRVVGGWEATARRAGIPGADIELTAVAFGAHAMFNLS